MTNRNSQPRDTAAPAQDTSDDPQAPGQARHGFRNEVSWDGGAGRHPYSNQGEEETPSPAAAAEELEGNRGDRSGRALEHLEQVKRKP